MLILAGGICGVLLFRSDSETETQPAAPSASTGNRAATAYIVLFFAGLLGLPILAKLFPTETLQIADAFYRAGSLVFGGLIL